jgi:hypothetical protein
MDRSDTGFVMAEPSAAMGFDASVIGEMEERIDYGYNRSDS